MAEQIKHEASDMLTYREKSLYPVRGSLKIFSLALIIFYDGWLFQVNYKRTGWLLFQINFDVYLSISLVQSVFYSFSICFKQA